jgi:hypothetical protein
MMKINESKGEIVNKLGIEKQEREKERKIKGKKVGKERKKGKKGSSRLRPP